MNKKFSSFKVAALAAAVALAMGSTVVMAAPPAATQLPGQGKLLTTGTASSTYTTGSTMDIALTDNTVIDWNQGTDFNKGGVGGFNIGSGATVNFTGTSSVLNLDSTGNASQIFGTLMGQGNVFVANGNGIIVGAGASISSSGASVGLIGNTLSPTVADGFAGGFASIGFNGTGGDVTVLPGATINGFNNVFISGGGTVNVDLAGVTAGSDLNLSAGLPQAGGAFADTNPGALLAVSNSAGDTNTPTTFASAGDASSSGGLNLAGVNQIDGTFTNTGVLTLGAGFAIDGALVNNRTVNGADVTLGGLINNGEFTAAGVVAGGDFVNNGKFTSGDISVEGADFGNNGLLVTSGAISVAGNLANAGVIDGSGNGVYVTGGDFTNTGSITGTGDITVTNGSLVNAAGGTLEDLAEVETVAVKAAAGYEAGADYSITNAGTMQGSLDLYANTDGDDLGKTVGNLTNTGTIDYVAGNGLFLYASGDLNLGGKVTLGGKALSATNPLRDVELQAGGVLTSAVPVFFGNSSASFAGNQVKLMANVTGGASATVDVSAGDQASDDYAVRVGSGVKVVAGGNIAIHGNDADVNPNMILNGTLSSNTFDLQGSDIFSGPNGSLVATGSNPYVNINFTGLIKTAPYLNDVNNFRYNYLPVTVTGTDPLNLTLNPTAYQTNGTSNGLSAVNILVNGAVNLQPNAIAPAVLPGGSAVTGVTNWENTHLVLQATGNLATASDFYWPGYVYLGTIASDAQGVAQPGTLGFGQITLGGDLNNVLPGNVDIGGGIHFMTAFPFNMNGHSVTTNANAWVNFATPALTDAYANGVLGSGLFFGGVQQGTGLVVNYGALDPSMFHTHVPNPAR